MSKRLAISLLLFAAASAQAATIYYCKCDTGSTGACTPGSDANAGTSSGSPKLNLPSTATLNASGAGGQHLFCRTGAWNDANNGIFFNTSTATAANPITVGAYTPSWATGSDNVPRINSTSTADANNCFRIYGTASNIVFRDFKCAGLGVTHRAHGIYTYSSPANIKVDNVEVSGYAIGMTLDSTATTAATSVQLVNSSIHDNWSQGVFGCGVNALIENNVFDNNGFTNGSGLLSHNHNIYCSVALGAFRLSGVIRGNKLTRSAVGAGVCQGNNIEMHNQVEDMVVENNVIDESAGAGDGCYGIEFNPGNGGATAEGANRLIVRGNVVINAGSFCYSFSSIRNSVIANNKCIWSAGQAFTKFGISNNANSVASEDLPDLNNTYVNNSVYLSGGSAADRCIYLRANPVSGSNTGLVVSGNMCYFDSTTSASSYCYEAANGLTSGSFVSWNRNQCYRAGAANNYLLLGAAAVSFGTEPWDVNGSVSDPSIVATPSSGNSWSLDFTAAITADADYCPILGFKSITHTGTCKAGAEQHGFSGVGPAAPTSIFVN